MKKKKPAAKKATMAKKPATKPAAAPAKKPVAAKKKPVVAQKAPAKPAATKVPASPAPPAAPRADLYAATHTEQRLGSVPLSAAVAAPSSWPRCSFMPAARPSAGPGPSGGP